MFNQTFVGKLKRQHYVKHSTVRKSLACYCYGNSQQIPAYFMLASELKENLQVINLENLLNGLGEQGTKDVQEYYCFLIWFVWLTDQFLLSIDKEQR